MNLREKILCAAASLEECTIDSLVVAAWRMWPDDFGLEGYENKYPHALAVHSKVYGYTGLIEKGLLGIERRKVWITDAGIREVKRLLTGM